MRLKRKSLFQWNGRISSWNTQNNWFPVLRSGGEFLSVTQWSSVRQGTQHFTDENKVSRKWSDSAHLLPIKLHKNNTTTHWVLFVKIQNQKSIKLSYNIYYKTRSQLYIRPTINQ